MRVSGDYERDHLAYIDADKKSRKRGSRECPHEFDPATAAF
jgi:hypothetical protein